jgi:hypothetical protein
MPRGSGEWAVRTAVAICFVVPVGLILGAPLSAAATLIAKHIVLVRVLPVTIMTELSRTGLVLFLGVTLVHAALLVPLMQYSVLANLWTEGRRRDLLPAAEDEGEATFVAQLFDAELGHGGQPLCRDQSEHCDLAADVYVAAMCGLLVLVLLLSIIVGCEYPVVSFASVAFFEAERSLHQRLQHRLPSSSTVHEMAYSVGWAVPYAAVAAVWCCTLAAAAAALTMPVTPALRYGAASVIISVSCFVTLIPPIRRRVFYVFQDAQPFNRFDPVEARVVNLKWAVQAPPSDEPDPNQCRIHGDGIERATVGEPSHFVVETFDEDGEPCIKGRSRPVISFDSSKSLMCGIGSDAPVWSMHDSESGAYHVTYTPECAGSLHISLWIANIELRGSPFEVSVKPSAVEDSLVWEACRTNPTSIPAGQPLRLHFRRLHPKTGEVVPVSVSKRRCVLGAVLHRACYTDSDSFSRSAIRR